MFKTGCLTDEALVRFIGEAGWRFNPSGETLHTPPRPIDRGKVVFKNMLNDDDRVHTGEKRIPKLLSAREMCLGPEHFFDCWNDRGRLPDAWKHASGETRYMYFDGGRHLVSPSGNKCVFRMWWEGVWRWDVVALSVDRYMRDVTAVLSPA